MKYDINITFLANKKDLKDKVEMFLNKFYKAERMQPSKDFPDYKNILINRNLKDFENEGFCAISHYDSVTGRYEVLSLNTTVLPKWMFL